VRPKLIEPFFQRITLPSSSSIALLSRSPTWTAWTTPLVSIKTWLGIPSVKKRLVILLSLSMTQVQSYPLLFVYSLTWLVSSCMSTPTIARPWSLYLLYFCLMMGSSALHGGHQVAQKSTHTGLPRTEDSVTG